MAERHQRCRYWPNCMIHTGDPVTDHRYQADVDRTEREQIRSAFAAGVPRRDLAVRHRLTYNIVFRITKGMPPKRVEKAGRA